MSIIKIVIANNPKVAFVPAGQLLRSASGFAVGSDLIGSMIYWVRRKVVRDQVDWRAGSHACWRGGKLRRSVFAEM